MKRLSVIVCLFMFALMPLLAQVKQTVAVLGDVFNIRGFHSKGICHLVHHCGSKSNRCQQGGTNLVVAGYQGRWLQDGQHQFLFRFHHLQHRLSG